MSDYTATRPATLPDYGAQKAGRKLRRHAIRTVAVTTCPKCQRSTYIVRTEETREPYDRTGCFWASCEYRGPR
jgi:hypothetical protein